MEHTTKSTAPKKNNSLLRVDTAILPREIIEENANSPLNASKVQYTLSNFNNIVITAIENSFANKDLDAMPTLLGCEIIEDNIERLHLQLPEGLRFDDIEKELVLGINCDDSGFSLTSIGRNSIEAIDISSNIYVSLFEFKKELSPKSTQAQ